MKRLILASRLLSTILLAPGSADAAPLYFPHVDTSLPWQTEIAIINAGDQTVTGTLRALRNTGQLVETKAVTLSARGRRQITVADEFTNHTDIGYIVFDTDSPAAQGYTKFYQAGNYRAAIPAVKEVNASDITISHIDSSAQWWTGVSLVNTTSAAKALTITFNNGLSVPYTLNANEHKAFTIGGLLNQPIQPDIQSAVITDASGIIGLELFGTNDGRQLDGLLLTGNTASTIYYPHVDSNGWWTGIVAYNPSASAATITITPYSAAGNPLSPKNLPIAGREKYVGVVSQLGLPAQTAWFKIDSTRPLSGFELFGTADGNQLAAYAGGGGATEGIFAKIEKNGWTGIAFVNTEDSAASVTLTARNDAGNAVATQALTVGAHAKVVNLAEAIFSQDIGAATYITYASDKNVVGFQLNGSSDGTMLDGLPSFHSSPLTQTNLGTPGKDFILQYGLGGNDTQYISGAAGDDWLEQYGGDGNDTMNVVAGSGNDVVHQDGGNGNDTMVLSGSQGNDWIFQFGGSGDDNVSGTGWDGNDTIYLSGGPGNDTMFIDGGTGNDIIRADGGEGDDTITYDVFEGLDVAFISGGPGSDSLTVNAGNVLSYTLVDESGRILCSRGTGGTYIIVKEVEQITVRGPSGDPICQPALPAPPGTPKASLFAHQMISGTDGDDTQITLGADGRDFILQYGLGGNDTLYMSGSSSDDWLEQDGGDGDDQMTVNGGTGNDLVHQDGGNGNDTLLADGGNDNDWIFQFGGPGDDNITSKGGLGNDTIYHSGGPGNDTLRVDAGEGDDLVRVDGGEGDDSVTYDVSGGQDTAYISGGPGIDSLTVTLGNNTNFTLVDESGRVLYSIGSGGTYLVVTEMEQITVLGAGGQTLYSLNLAGAASALLVPN